MPRKILDVLVSAPTCMGFAMSALTGNDAETELTAKRDFKGEGEG